MKAAYIRMPIELYNALRDTAQRERRSITSMIVVLVEEALRRRAETAA